MIKIKQFKPLPKGYSLTIGSSNNIISINEYFFNYKVYTTIQDNKTYVQYSMTQPMLKGLGKKLSAISFSNKNIVKEDIKVFISNEHIKFEIEKSYDRVHISNHFHHFDVIHKFREKINMIKTELKSMSIPELTSLLCS